MARNLKKENLKKLSGIITSNGFKVDLGNFIYNPSHDYEYPSLVKMTNETETTQNYTRVKYFKYYNGTGKYFLETYSRKKNNDNNSWQVITDSKEEELEDGKRFNLKKLIELAENIA